jgi:hypothetical protein
MSEGNTDHQPLSECEGFEAISDGLGRFWAYHLHGSLMRGLILPNVLEVCEDTLKHCVSNFL